MLPEEDDARNLTLQILSNTVSGPQRYPKMPRLTFIAMRDPIDRIFSHYNYIRGTRYAGACTIGRTATFEEW